MIRKDNESKVMKKRMMDEIKKAMYNKKKP